MTSIMEQAGLIHPFVEIREGRPIVVVNADPGVVILDARHALHAVNAPPWLFRRGGLLSRVGSDDDARAVIIPLNPAGMRAELARAVSWVRMNSADEGKEPKPPVTAGVPPIVGDDLLSHGDQLTFCSVLEQIVTAPVFAPDGTLITEPGYNLAARIWYHPMDGTRPSPVAQYPRPNQVDAARRFLLEEFLGDFPFDSEASRQRALATLLLPFIRLMIKGPVLLHVVDATTPGSGKGLLQRALMFPALGSMLPAMPGTFGDEEELRKKITTALVRGQQVIRWDNVTDRIDSPVLSSALTEPVWQDRMLGFNRDVEVPIRAIYLANGNNLQYSQEIARRVIPVRLDVAAWGLFANAADAERPWDRRGFRHPDLMAWSREMRSWLVHAALTLVQSWVATGKPEGSPTLGSYEEWSKVTGGIMAHVCGQSRLLEGLEQVYADAVTERDAKLVFLETWAAVHGGNAVTPQQVLDMIITHGCDPFDATAKGNERGKVTALGSGLSRMRGQVWNCFRIEKEGRFWRLYKLDGSAT
jgi:putative DNA primase/helicase